MTPVSRLIASAVRWISKTVKGNRTAEPINGEAEWLNRSAVLKASKDWEGLLDLSLKWVEGNPNDAIAWFNLGVAYLELHRYDDAVDACQQALKIKPDYVSSWINLGYSYHELQRKEGAIDALQQALKIEPDLALAWYNLGIIYDELKQYEKAIEAYQQALKAKPENASAWINLGNIYGELQRYDEAVDTYLQALKIEPDNDTAWRRLGTVYLQLERYVDAVTPFQEALRINPNETSRKGLELTYAALAIDHGQSGNQKAALDVVEKLREIAPQKADELEELVTPYSTIAKQGREDNDIKSSRTHFAKIQSDQHTIIEFDANVLAWIDESTNLMWEVKNRDNCPFMYVWHTKYIEDAPISEGPDSDKYIPYEIEIKDATSYVERLNENMYAGFCDWRIPTVEELESLIDLEGANYFIKKPLQKNTLPAYWTDSPTFFDINGYSSRDSRPHSWWKDTAYIPSIKVVDFQKPATGNYAPNGSLWLRCIRSNASSKHCTGAVEDGFKLSRTSSNADSIEKNAPKAVHYSNNASKEGDAEAQYALGKMYELGKNNVQQDFSKAFEQYSIAADQGHAGAQNSLGCMFIHGKGIPQEWYSSVDDKKADTCLSTLGLKYIPGKGVTYWGDDSSQRSEDFNKCNSARFEMADIWWKKSADQGHAEAQFNLGLGSSVFPEGYKDAIHWLREAAEAGHAKAEKYLVNVVQDIDTCLESSDDTWRATVDYLLKDGSIDDSQAEKFLQKSIPNCYDHTRISYKTKQQIKEFALERGIKHLVHFTKIENIDGIVSNGLRGRNYLDSKFYKYLFNDSIRLDKFPTSSCLSVSFPNNKMFYKYRMQDKSVDWVVLLIDPSVLWENECAFCHKNAAGSTVRSKSLSKLMSFSSFQSMFYEDESRTCLDDNLTTDPQAEILCFEKIPLEKILTFAFESTTAKSIFDERHPHLNSSVNREMFQQRSDATIYH